MKLLIKIMTVAFAVFGCKTTIAQTTTDSLQLRGGGILVKLLAQPSTAAYSIQLPAAVPAQRQFLGISSVTGTTGIGAWMDSTAFKNTYWSLTGNTGTTPSTSAYGAAVNNNFIGTTDQQDWVVATNNLERMRILSGSKANTDGDVVIGTQIPDTVASSASNSTAAKRLAKLTVAEGDAGINGLTIGLGGGQEPTNTALGFQALYNVDTLSSVGEGSGWNTAVGYQSAYHLIGGWGNTAIGRQSLYSATTHNQNTAVGNESQYYNVDGYYNTATGYRSLLFNIHGSANVANGAWALFKPEGSDNTVIGTESMRYTTSGSSNTAVGRGAGRGLNSGNDNVFLGAWAGNTAISGDSNIIIGYNQQLAVITGSKQLNIGGAIFGTGMTGTVSSPAGNIGINTAAPGNTLEVKSTAANTSGLRFTNLVNAPVLGTNASGDVITATVNPANGLFWGLTGNAGTTAGTNFLGTTDDQDLVFKRYNLQAGWLNYALANTAFGVRSLPVTTTANAITAIGFGALANNTSGNGQNTAIGFQAANGLTTGSASVAVGYLALGSAACTGTNNVAVGTTALAANTSGSYNTAINSSTLSQNTTGNNNTAVGFAALTVNKTGNNNTAIGVAAGNKLTTSSNVAVGAYALYTASTGSNVAVGCNALNAEASGSVNTAIGNYALASQNGGSYNTAVGDHALYSNTTSSSVTAVGYQALYWNSTGGNNVGIGYQASSINKTGTQNTSIGSGALYSNTVSDNTALGYHALYANTSGTANLGLGSGAVATNTTGSNNVGVGYAALASQFGATNNTGVGTNALKSNVSGGNNTAIGYNSGSNVTGSSNIAIGANVTDVTVNANSNQMNIGNTVFGTGMTGTVAAPAGNIGINTATPGNTLEVKSTASGTSGLRLTNFPNVSILATDANGDVISGVTASSGSSVSKQRLINVSPSVVLKSPDGNYSFRYNCISSPYLGYYWQILNNKGASQGIAVFIEEFWNSGSAGYDVHSGTQTLTAATWTNFVNATGVGTAGELNVHRIYDLTTGTIYRFEGMLINNGGTLQESMIVEQF